MQSNSITTESWRQPDPTRTLFYFDFEQSLSDLSWNWNNPIASSWIWYEEVGWQYVVKNTTSTPYIQMSNSVWNSISDFTISFRIYPKKWSWQWDVLLFWHFNSNSPFAWPNIFYMASWPILVRMTWNNPKFPCYLLENTRQHLVFTRMNWICYLYLNSVLQLSWEDTTSRTWSEFYIFSRNMPTQQFKATWTMWDKFIHENIWRTQENVSKYFNKTKSIYWL